MLSCKHIVGQGSDYLEDELSFWRKVEMKLHLLICVRCRRYVKQLKQTIAMLAQRRKTEPSELQIRELTQRYQEVSSKH